MQIAFQYLIPRQILENGLAPAEGKAEAQPSPVAIEFSEEAVHQLIRYYTREAGVRNLERELGTICRKVARRKAEGTLTEVPFVVGQEAVREFLGGPKLRLETEVADRTALPGVAVGLAWTPAGGDILFVEANKMKGGHKDLIMTGHLGPVMQESMQAALSWVRSHYERFPVAVGQARPAPEWGAMPPGCRCCATTPLPSASWAR